MITITGENIQDIRGQLGSHKLADISISPRTRDFGRELLGGAIVDATKMGAEVPVVCESLAEVMQYLGLFLKDKCDGE